ncbi:MAG TPA: hypothetical protein RMH99_26895, partial [Sandaracinaceae bacterium LLY-WYZ-13_1]|nr:hypothetical protein [Sandaracinaceae bacterium LLY-WYZ-13_1]
VMNIALNILCGGRVLDDIEIRRNDLVFIDALGARSIPDPTTAGDYCQRGGGEPACARGEPAHVDRQPGGDAEKRSGFVGGGRRRKWRESATSRS